MKSIASNIINIIKTKGLEWFGRYYSIYQGVVVDNKDPEFIGRLKVQVPQIYGKNIYDYWALPKGMFAGKGIGFFAIPNIDDAVWVSFQGGNPDYPVWEYGWFATGEVMESAKGNGNIPENIVLQSSKKQRITISDSERKIIITDVNNNKIIMSEKGISIVSDKISLGNEDISTDPIVKGNELVAVLQELITDIGLIGAIPIVTGATSTLNSSPLWQGFSAKWNIKFNNILSSKVTTN